MTKIIFRTIIFLIIASGTLIANGQNSKKVLRADFADNEIIIDGELNEKIWKTADTAKKFIQMRPYNGKAPITKTVAFVMYNNNSLFVSAQLYDSLVNKIDFQLSERDNLPNTDFFGIYIDPFNDCENAYGFFVSAAGVQMDLRSTENGEDTQWSAVWKSAVSKNADGWAVEMEIPFSALRFSSEKEQSWSINFIRNTFRIREKSSWNFVDAEIGSFNQQFGKLEGIKNINSPLRLAFIPYFSTYAIHNSETNEFGKSIKGGLDVKLGISKSFTLDMMLIPDFGQIQSDDKVLNLTPYETFYGEKRPFFTEGSDLFSKGNIFYSRRIGSLPVGYSDVLSDLKTNEVIKENPAETQILNATKLTGKTKHGLSIGLINAITSNTYAQIEDTLLQTTRNFKTQAFTNYSMLVLDQSLRKNSTITFANSNVYRIEDEYNANVSIVQTKLYTKSQKYYLNGKIGISHILNNKSTTDGKQWALVIAKAIGKFKFGFTQTFVDDKFNSNDLGYMSRNNELMSRVSLYYNIYQPFWRFLGWNNSSSITYNRLYSPQKYTSFSASYASIVTFLNYLSVGIVSEISPVKGYDYYEPRVANRFYTTPKSYYFENWWSSDYRKRLALDVRIGLEMKSDNSTSCTFILSPRFRFTDHFTSIYEINYERDINSLGFADKTANNDTVFFGRRNVSTVTNSITASYYFNNKSSINLRARHYWRKVIYNDFYILNTKGTLTDENMYSVNKNVNYNIFTLNFSYVWQFAPGSELSLVWKNNIFKFNTDTNSDYVQNFQNIFSADQTNSISIKVLYYLDVNYLKKKNRS